MEWISLQRRRLEDAQVFREETFTKQDLFKQGNTSVFVLNFMPGQSLPAHRHPGQGVYILVLQGKGNVTYDGEELLLAEGDVFYGDGDQKLSVTNGGDEPLSLYVVLS